LPLTWCFLEKRCKINTCSWVVQVFFDFF